MLMIRYTFANARVPKKNIQEIVEKKIKIHLCHRISSPKLIRQMFSSSLISQNISNDLPFSTQFSVLLIFFISI